MDDFFVGVCECKSKFGLNEKGGLIWVRRARRFGLWFLRFAEFVQCKLENLLKRLRRRRHLCNFKNNISSINVHESGIELLVAAAAVFFGSSHFSTAWRWKEKKRIYALMSRFVDRITLVLCRDMYRIEFHSFYAGLIRRKYCQITFCFRAVSLFLVTDFDSMRHYFTFTHFIVSSCACGRLMTMHMR